MLRILRKKGVMKKLLWAVAILIILSFGIMGTAGYLTDSGINQHAGKIFGKSVSTKDYQKAYADVRDQALMIHGDNLDQMMQYLDLESEAWDRLILLHEANRQKIKVNDEEVIEYLQPSPMFHREGKFDKYLYEDIIKFVFQRPTRDFEEGIRNQLKINKLISQKTDNINITDDQLRKAYREENERVKVNYVIFSPDEFLSNSTASDEELKNYFIANPKEFEVPPSVNVEYITFPFHEDMMDAQKAALGDTVRDIVFPELESGKKKFKEVAEKSNLTIEETGFFSIENPILNFGWSFDNFNDVFNASKGDFVGPFETEQGMQIVRIKEQRESFTPTFEEAKPRVLETVLKNKAFALAQEKAAEFHNNLLKLADSAAFSTLAEQTGLSVQTTPFFALGEYLPNIGISNDFQKAALTLSAEKPYSNPVKTTKGYVVIEFQEMEKIDETKFAEEKETFKQRYLSQQRLNVVTEFMTQLREEADLKINRN